MFRFAQHDKLQITSRRLFAFDGFEERLEVAFAKTLRAFALNNFEKQRRPVFYWLGKYLQQITFIIAIDEDAQSLQGIEFFVNMTHPIEQRVVIGWKGSAEIQRPASVGPLLFQ